MKKLTAGIFTVLIGLCAANSADAAVASKGYAEAVANAAQAAAEATAATKADAAQAAAEATAAADATSKANAAQAAAEKTASDALQAYKTEQAGVDSTQNTNISNLTTLVGTLPEGTADGTTVVEYINKKTEGIATDAALGELQSTVSTNTTNIDTNAEAIAKINGDATTEGSFAKAIADSIAALSAEDGAIKNVADALATHETTAASTYQTKANIYTDTTKKIDSTLADIQYPSVGYVDAKIEAANTGLGDLTDTVSTLSGDVTGLKNLVGTDTVETQINTAVEGLTEGAIKTNADDIDALEGRMTTAEGDIDALDKTLNDETDGLIKKVAANATLAAKNAEDVASNAAAIARNTESITSHSEAISNNTTAISNEISRATAAEGELQAAIDTKLTAKTSVNSGIVTTDADGDIIPVAPAACENMLNYCVLTYGRASETAEPGYIWEVVTRDDEGK